MAEVKLDLDAFRAIFFEEADEHLVTFESGLLQLETSPNDGEVIGQIFRSAHSIKGASGTFGLNDVMTFTHALETVLDRLRSKELAYRSDVAKVLLSSVDVLRALLDAARSGTAAPATAVELRVALERLLTPQEPAEPARRIVDVRFVPKPEFMSRGMDPLATLRDLITLGEVKTREIDASRVPELALLEPEACYLAFRVVLSTAATDAELREVFEFVDDLCVFELRPGASPAGSPAVGAPASPEASGEALPASALEVPEHAAAAVAAPAAAQVAAHAPPATIRVATEKVDRLLDLVGEIVIAQAMIAEATRSQEKDATSRLNDALQAMNRHTRELQERVMSIRMVPIDSVFRRLPRMVRDVAESVGKKVKLVIEGETTEIDKSMVEQLADPLTHLVRNAIDHGLESADERGKTGKPDEGSVFLRAFHQGGNIVIEVADDGRGLSTDAIRSKAERLGLIGADAALTDEQLHEFIFHAGFSTAAKVSDVSGRGVGMDVVKRNIEALNGSLSLTTERGRGTCVRLRLPLTLAILDGLAVRVGSQTLVVPLLTVVEAFRPTRLQIRNVVGAGEVLDVRGRCVPIVRLHEIVGASDAQCDPTLALVCVVEANGINAALLVDEVLGQGQFVVKSLEANFRRVDCIMGATILGDGRVAMIVDVPTLARAVSSSTGPRASEFTEKRRPVQELQ